MIGFGTTGATITGLVKRLRKEATALLHAEFELAKTEMLGKAKITGRHVAFLAAGALILAAGALFLLLALTAALAVTLVHMGASVGVAISVAPLVVGAIVAIIGIVLAQKGLDGLQHQSLAPRQAIESMKENQEWIREKMT